MNCRVSVCMPTYNGEKYIRKQLETILCQLEENDEIIVSDDSSTDSTLAIVESFADPRIKILRGNSFHSPIFNMENALKHATGDFIFLTDQDDYWLDGKLQLMMDSLQNHCMVISDCKVVDANENVIYPSLFRLLNSGSGFWKNFKRNSYLGCCMAIRRSVLDYVLPFPKNIPMHDIWIGSSVEFRHQPTIFLPKILHAYRRHGQNISSTSEISCRPLYRKLLDRWNLLVSLLKRNYLE